MPMKPRDVDSYIARFQRRAGALKKVRRAIRAAAPKATKSISYRHSGVPAERHAGVLRGFQSHIGLYPPVRGNAALEKAAAKYAGPKGNLRFSHEQPLPLDSSPASCASR